MLKIKYATVYDRFDRKEGINVDFKDDKGLTQQQFKDECDVNNIVSKYVKTGVWNDSIRPATNMPMWGDFTNAPDYQTAMDRLNQAQADFDSLPSRIRKRFNNDPSDLLEFLSKKENYDEAVSLGILNKPSDPASPPEAGITPGSDGKK